MIEKWPTSSELTKAFLITLNEMGGTGNVKDLDELTIKRINLSPELIAIKRSGTRGEIQYRLAWIRTKAKQNGLASREVDKNWKITEKGKDYLSINKAE